MTLEIRGGYTDAGATSDGGETVTTSGTVDVNTVGVYTVTYSASDAAGNTGTATRNVTVIEQVDTTAPVISLTGAIEVTVEVGGGYTEGGAKSDGGETVKTSGTVDIDKTGVYMVTYNATDATGNAAVEVVRTVNVVDTKVPVITLSGKATVQVEAKGYVCGCRGECDG